MKEWDRTCSYRGRIQDEIERMRPQEVFATTSYSNLMKSIARELTDGRFDNVYLYYKPEERYLGWCDGKKVVVNLGNRLTEGFSTISQKNVSLVGILGHECGHQNYTDFGLREKYLDGILEGIWYPYPPNAQNRQEEQDLEQLKDYFDRKDKDALELIAQVAAYLHNILEDIYAEDKMCARFPGSVRRGILLNRERNVEWIPTLRELLEEKEDNVSILMNLYTQYALSGRINNWDNGEHELLETVDALLPIIKNACADERSSTRFLATNTIILKIWRYLYEIIQEIEKRRKEQEQERKKEKEEKNGGEDSEGSGEKTGNGGTNGNGNTSSGDQRNTKPGGNVGDANSAEQDSNQEEGNQISSAMQEYLEHLAGRIPQIMEESAGRNSFRGFPKDVKWTGAWSQEESEKEKLGDSVGVSGKQEEDNQNPGGENGKENKEAGYHSGNLLIKIVDADGRMQEILRQMAKERVDQQINQEINLCLQKEMDAISFDAGHEKVKKKVLREYQITEFQKKQYEECREQVKRVQKRLISIVLPILQEQGARTERQLFMGKKIDMRNIAHPQGAIYRKDYPGKKVDLALEVLLDVSDSMRGKRIKLSKLAALCLYEFCRMTGIPVAVYGHHTDGLRHKCLEDETVYLHCCAEFVPDENDRYRITALEPAGANRDGVALRFMGEKLLKRPEKQKLLVLISDGLPNSNQYRGKQAREDVTAIKKEMTSRGIIFLAAAIGEDKEKIREIYQEAFLDISEIEKLPIMLMKQVLKYVRRY